MRSTLSVITLFTVFLLQACGSQTAKAESDSLEHSQLLSEQAVSDISRSNQANQNTYQIKPVNDDRFPAPETQIIRELYHAGCVIEDFELDRRKQNMHISCAKDHISDNSNI